jgi:hypothetical protein
LLKKYDKLWVFGDSFTSPDICVTPQESFWGICAQYLGIEFIKNCSRPTNSFDSVCHMLVSMQDQYNWDNDVFLIGVPPLERITVFDNFKDTAYIGHEFATNNWSMSTFTISCHHGLVSKQNYGTDKELIIHSDRSWVETQALRTIFLLTAWLDSKNANYFVVNLSKPFDSDNKWGPSEFVLSHGQKHNRCILFEDTYHSINLNRNKPADFSKYGWDGHHGPEGNKYFFEQSLLPAMKKEKFC